MTEEQIYAALSEIFHDAFLRNDLVLTPLLSAEDVPGWDSFKQIEILFAIEQHFKIRFNTREVDRMSNVGDLARAVAVRFPAHKASD
jgi:acyl carrier protein